MYVCRFHTFSFTPTHPHTTSRGLSLSLSLPPSLSLTLTQGLVNGQEPRVALFRTFVAFFRVEPRADLARKALFFPPFFSFSFVAPSETPCFCVVAFDVCQHAAICLFEVPKH